MNSNKELKLLKQDLIKLEIEQGIKQPKFWLGIFFILISLILTVNFMIV